MYSQSCLIANSDLCINFHGFANTERYQQKRRVLYDPVSFALFHTSVFCNVLLSGSRETILRLRQSLMKNKWNIYAAG